MEAPEQDSGKSVNWYEVFIFYVVAVAVSAPFRLQWIRPEELLPLPFGLNILYSIFWGIGPAVGFFVVVHLMKSKVHRSLSFWGVDKKSSLIAILIIPVGFVIIGVTNTKGLNPHYEGLVYGLMLALYALGEEFGWRGYLQEALAPLKMWQKVVLIAVMWFVWHLNFLKPDTTLRLHLIHFASLALGSWGLLKITEVTKSILFAAAVHLSFNIMVDGDNDFNRRLVVLTIAAATWIFLMRSIITRKARANKS